MNGPAAIPLVALAICLSGGCQGPRDPIAGRSELRGKVLVLPGVINTRLHLTGFAKMLGETYPALDIETRTWGIPLLSLHNLRAYEQNLRTARTLAGELATYRREHPQAAIHLVGYSGGGGMAVFVAAALPDDVTINRLILVAPAISPDFPLETQVFPHVRDYVVNFASSRDAQIGWGTRNFGTMDRKNTTSAGYGGFEFVHPKLVQIHWTEAMIRDGHYGNHLSYLALRWQRKYLLPLFDPQMDVGDLKELFPADGD